MGEPQWARLATLAPATRLAGAFPFLFVLFSYTSQNVQGWSADEVTDDDDTYQSFECIACTRVHLVNVGPITAPSANHPPTGATITGPT